ncbi:MAG: peptide chain release factor-like protein [Phycisphaerales bacterium]|jgi:hypothetical protein|nr:peptide chain release factor-like protein [Phycisphaerales bacterium]MBT7171120.1 peptide chain release factor-like protein [Phycisphaerales bacterium]
MREYLTLSDDALLAQCEQHIYKASGPGGQHRNKVSSAVRLHHQPTKITATANDSRSQHDNRKNAIRRLRMNIATKLRADAPAETRVPEIIARFLHLPKRAKHDAEMKNRLEVGRKHKDYWHVAAVLLDCLAADRAQLSTTAKRFGITTSNLIRTIKADRHFLEAAQNLRKQHSLSPIK